MGQVLSTKNVELLKLIEKKRPQSIRELADLFGRKKKQPGAYPENICLICGLKTPWEPWQKAAPNKLYQLN